MKKRLPIMNDCSKYQYCAPDCIRHCVLFVATSDGLSCHLSFSVYKSLCSECVDEHVDVFTSVESAENVDICRPDQQLLRQSAAHGGA